MGYLNKSMDWANRNKKALGWVAGGTAAAVATHLGFDTRAFHGQSLYDMTGSWIRFVPYFATAVSYGKAFEITAEGQKGRELTPRERLGEYAKGALVASGLWEAIENASSIPQIYNALHDGFNAIGHGDYIKNEFPGKGIASLGDFAINLGLTELFAYAKNKKLERENSIEK